METIDVINGMEEAIETLTKARGKLASGSMAIWRIVNHAIDHLDQQIADLLAPEVK